MRSLRRPMAGALAAFWALTPATALAQAPKAGVVTTLEGPVTARRAVLPAPVALKFKDDVFLRDTIATGERGFARFLLGGKAVVTVRERSVMTITEVPGRSTVEIESGKIGLAVARERMQPGEVIDVRTPNAIVAVRGTVLVAEVGQTAAGGTTGPQPITDVYMLRGTADADTLNPATRAALGKPFVLSDFQALNVVGSAPPKVSTFTAAQVGQITAGLRAQGLQHKDAANQEQVKTQVVNATVSVLSALAGDSADLAAAVAPAVPQNLGRPSFAAVTVAPINPLPANFQQLLDVPDISLSGNVDLPAGLALKSYTGDTNRAGLSPVVQIVNGPLPLTSAQLDALTDTATLPELMTLARSLNILVQQLGTDNLIEVLPGAQVALNGSLLDVQNAAVINGARILDVAGLLSSSTSQALLHFDPSLLVSVGDFVRVGPGGFLSLAGSLIDALDSDLRATGRGHLVNVVGLAGGVSGPAGIVAAGNLLNFVNSNVIAEGNLLRIADGAFVGGGAPGVPLVVFDNSTLTSGLGFNAVSGGSLLRMFSRTGQPGALLTLLGPYVRAVGSALTMTDAPAFNVTDGAVIIASGAEPFASFIGSIVTSANHLVNFDTATSFTVPGQPTTVGSGGPVFVSLAGGLLDVQGGQVATQNVRGILRLNNDVTLVQTGLTPLLRFLGATIDSDANIVLLTSAAGQPAPVLTVGGTLLEAVNTALFSGNPLVNTNGSVLFVGDSATVASAADVFLLRFVGTSVDAAGNIVSIRRSKSSALPTRLSLAGPLFLGQDSVFNTTSLGFANNFGGPAAACCNGFFVSQGALVGSTTSQYLIQLVRSSFNSGPDAQSGGTFFQAVDTFTGAPAAEIVAPPSIVLAGGLLLADTSTISALFSILQVGRATLISTSPNALIQALNSTLSAGGLNSLDGSTAGGRLFNQFASNTSGTIAAAPSMVSLSAPLALLVNSSVTTTLDLVGVFNGARLTSTTTDALIQFVGSVLNPGSTTLVNRILGMVGLGGPTGADFATIVLNGPVLSAVNSSLNNPDGVIGIFAGAQLIVNGSGAPVATIVGGTHALGSRNSGTLLAGVGRITAVANEIADGVALTLGTDQSIVTSRTLLESVGASITTSRVAFFDHTLFQATAPIFSGKAGSTLTATVGLELAAQAKVTSLGPVFVLDASLLDIVAGAAILVNGGSLLRVAGDLTALSNGSALRMRNGPMVRVQGNSVLNVTGALVRFGGTGGNSINVTNLFCVAVCPTVGGIPVALLNGASLSNVTITNPIKNGNLGTVVASPPPGVVTVNSPAVIVLDGPNSRVTISGN